MTRRLAICLLACSFSGGVFAADGNSDWAYQTPKKKAIPSVKGATRNAIDAFLLARMEKVGVEPSGEADKRTLIRRATFDLTGLPPTPEEVDAFVGDPSPEAYSRLIDRLLASPAYGERWARHWLDLARYSDSDGFKADRIRPHSFRYRDYVIRSLNADKPFDRFVREQIAGDELFPGDREALVATGFLRQYPDEENAANLPQRRQEILDELTDTVGATFLGLTVGCARCHDHKYDPISQKDYFRLQAFFAGFGPKDLPLAPKSDDAGAAKARTELVAIEAKARKDHYANRFQRFPVEVQTAVNTPVEKRTPLQDQLAAMADLQLQMRPDEIALKMTKNADWKRLMGTMKSSGAATGEEPRIMAFCDGGRRTPPTYVLKNGSFGRNEEEVEPGFPECTNPSDDPVCTPTGTSSGRRAALADWLVSKENPLTARVIVNRVWHHHFGRGIVANPSDFGVQGQGPSHPELLDWLACEFVDHGWSLKWLHRTIMASATYRRENAATPSAMKKDPENRLLSRASRRRLEAEAARDAVLAVAGLLDRKQFGSGVFPPVPAELPTGGAWSTSKNASDHNRRSIYLFVRRNMRYPLLAALDQPDSNFPCACRETTTTAPQALFFMNDALASQWANALASRVLEEAKEDRKQAVVRCYRICFGRDASEVESAAAVKFCDADEKLLVGEGKKPADAAKTAITDFCQAMLASNEFLHVD